jgi:mono/diheme cytochrome c family protein
MMGMTVYARVPLFLMMALALFGTPALVSAQAPAPAATASNGFFTEAQARQGREAYTAECVLCHAPREFSGNVFQRRWLTPPVSGIFSHILNTMPQDAPGSLSPTQVAAIVAYILQMNGQPAGPTPLPTEIERLAQIRVSVDSGDAGAATEATSASPTPRR